MGARGGRAIGPSLWRGTCAPADAGASVRVVSTESQVAINRAQWERQENDRRVLEEQQRRQVANQRKAKLKVEGIRTGSGHRLIVRNPGPATARDVRVAFMEAKDGMPVPPERENAHLRGELIVCGRHGNASP